MTEKRKTHGRYSDLGRLVHCHYPPGYGITESWFLQTGGCKIVVKIRLTAAIVKSFAGRELEPSMIILTLTGFGVLRGVFNGIATFEHDLFPDTHQDISQRKWSADDNDRGRSAVLCIFAMSKTAKKASGNLFTIADRQKRRFLLE